MFYISKTYDQFSQRNRRELDSLNTGPERSAVCKGNKRELQTQEDLELGLSWASGEV